MRFGGAIPQAGASYAGPNILSPLLVATFSQANHGMCVEFTGSTEKEWEKLKSEHIIDSNRRRLHSLDTFGPDENG